MGTEQSCNGGTSDDLPAGFIFKGMYAGFEHAYLIREASALGVRESYRIVGKYVLSEDDYIKRARFEDAVAKGDWYIDVHSATKGLVIWRSIRGRNTMRFHTGVLSMSRSTIC